MLLAEWSPAGHHGDVSCCDVEELRVVAFEVCIVELGDHFENGSHVCTGSFIHGTMVDDLKVEDLTVGLVVFLDVLL